MTKINELNINITKAVITSISIELGDKEAEWSISGKLLTKENKEISNFSFGSEHYNDDRKIEIPVSMNVWARNMFEELAPVIKEKRQNWYFSFGSGQLHDGRYVKFFGTRESTRKRMFDTWGQKWSTQYSEKQWNNPVKKGKVYMGFKPEAKMTMAEVWGWKEIK